MALLRITDTETLITNRRGLVVDGENDLVWGGLRSAETVLLPPDKSTPNVTVTGLEADEIGVHYNKLEVHTFEHGLRCLGRKSSEYFFLTSLSHSIGVCTHIDALIEHPELYMHGILKENLRRIGGDADARQINIPKVRRLVEQSRKFG